MPCLTFVCGPKVNITNHKYQITNHKQIPIWKFKTG